MADKIFSYKNYFGSIECSLEDRCLFGQILHIRDLVLYEGQNIDELERAFHDAVDTYLKTCEEEGKSPDKPCSGTFNVRIGEDAHRSASVAASRIGKSLNDFVKDAITAAVERLNAEPQVIHQENHHYHHHHYHAENGLEWEEQREFRLTGRAKWQEQETRRRPQ